MPRSAFPLTGFLVLALAAALRLTAIGVPSLWFDEAFSLTLARQPAADISRLVAGDTHPPLYYLTLHAWLKGGDGIGWARGCAAFADLLTIGLLASLSPRESPRLGLLAGLFAALASTMILQARQVRMYAQLTLAATAAVFALSRALDRGTWMRWLAFALCAAATALTHHAGAIAMVAAAGLVPLAAWRRAGPEPLWSRFFAAVAVSLVIYGAVLGGIARHQLHTRTFSLQPTASQLGRFVDLTAGTLPAMPGARAACVLAFGAALVRSAWSALRGEAPPLVTRLWVFALAALLLTPQAPGGIFANRMSFYLQPTVLVLAAHGVLVPWRGRVASGAACVLLLAASAWNGLTAPEPRYSWRACAEVLRGQAPPGALVVTYNPSARLLLESYLSHVDLATLPVIEPAARFDATGPDYWRRITEADLARLEGRIAGRASWFLVLSSPETAESVELLRKLATRRGTPQRVGDALSPAIWKFTNDR